MMRSTFVTFMVVALVAGCGSDAANNASNNSTQGDAGNSSIDGDSGAVDATAESCATTLPNPGDEPLELLSEYCFFGGNTGAHEPTDALLPYDVNSTLFSDDTLKFRYIALPEGSAIEYAEMDRWEWPIGATIVKTFYYPQDESQPDGPRRILETRLLVNEGEEWATHSYRWNEEQTDAEYTRLGSWVDVERTVGGETVATRYRIPDKNSCKNCHAQDDKVVPLGPRTWQMNKSFAYADGSANQLDRMAERGWLNGFDGDPESAPALATDPEVDETEDLNVRARSYLEANCAHCHNPQGAGGTSGLDLSWMASDPQDYGICKRPVAAGEGSGGLFFDIVPGRPEESIMVYRMASEDPGFKMPELPTLTSHEEGVQLISDWISAMEPAGCPE